MSMKEPLEQWIEELLKLNEEQKMTRKQASIIEAAIEVFSEKGYAASSTSEIAQKAGVAEGTIFRHYRTKKDLLISIITPMMTKLIAPFVLRDFSKVLDAPFVKYEDFVRALILNRLEFIKNNMKLLKILVQEIPFHPELQEQFKQHVARKVFERIEAIVKHFQDDGQILKLPTTTVIRLTASSIIGFIISRFFIVPEKDWDDEREIEITLQFIMHGLAAR